MTNNKTLAQLYAEHEGKVSDKWSLYLSEYDRLFSQYRNKPIRMLEIGIQNGGSLDIWSKYFPDSQALIGCDINPDCAKLQYDDPRTKIVIGDANTDAVQAEITQHCSEFDIIIDDGSHLSSDIVKTFLKYFSKITDGGIFIAEDLHCSYWQEFEGGLFDPFSAITFFKHLADVVNHEHWGVEKKRTGLFKGFCSKYDVEVDEGLLEQVHSIEFINSICVVRKSEMPSNQLGNRFIAGKIETVISGHDQFQGTPLNAPSQNDNYWSSRKKPPSEELSSLLNGLAASRKQATALTQDLEKRDVQIAQLELTADEKNTQILAILASRSWRITRPIRAIGNYLKKNQNRTQNLPKRFDADWYLQQNPDVAACGMEPYEHYITYGKKEGRPATPAFFLPRKVNKIRIFFSALQAAIQRKGSLRAVCRTVVISLKNEGWKGVKSRIALLNAEASRSAGRNDYTAWIGQYDTLSDEKRANMRSRIDTHSHQPLISVVMPTYNPNPEWLTAAIKSVQKQIYPHWELCIADDLSTNPKIRRLLTKLSQSDSRIKVVFREKNGHISAATNTALEFASGDWIALMDHDDLLAEHALFCVADAINHNPDARMIYSDEDKIDEAGNRHDPYFKCDWNLDLFLSQNMFCHLGAYEHKLVKEVKGFRVGLEGAQDYDLALRCMEKVERSQIHHIPHVLYHWRAHDESTARSANAKPYADLAAEEALNEHFNRVGVDASVASTECGYRAQYKLPKNLPLVSLIIPTRNGLELLRQCITSILEKTTYTNYEIIVVDNGSDDPEIIDYFTSLAVHPKVVVITDNRPFNYSQLNNSAVEIANGEVIGLINNDIEVISPEWLSEMVSHALRPSIGAVGAKLLYPNGTIQHGGVVLGLGGVAGHSHKHFPKESPGYFYRLNLISGYSAVTAACLVVRRLVYEQVGGLNESDLKIAFNDVDFCLRLREAGYRNIWTPYAELYHHESVTRGYEDTPEKQARFAAEVEYMKETWGKLLEIDPAYSPNLTQDHEDFSYAWPPRVNAIMGVCYE